MNVFKDNTMLNVGQNEDNVSYVMTIKKDKDMTQYITVGHGFERYHELINYKL